jgi:divalent metal cation (Fe/Co/Zn/Cd) transporter
MKTLTASSHVVLVPAAGGAFGTVIWVVCIAAAVIAVFALLSSGKAWEDFGRGHLLMDREAPPAGSGAARDEREEEIRQMLEARNARRRRRGEAPIDVEAEMRRLTAPQVDPELRQEIRHLVTARNYRRVRAGKPPLDVEAEVEREIARLGEL